MSIAFLYAGQGSQVLGMGRDLFEKHPVFQEIIEKVDPDSSYRQFMFGEDLEALSATEHTQPCMVAFAVAMTALLKEKGISPVMTAGLSLGEYSALACSGVFSSKQAVELVAYRGKVMSEGVQGISSGMVAVLGLEAELLEKACEQASSLGVVEIANYNCPGQLVMGGETAALEEASKIAKELGAKRCLPLKVSGPFHTSLLASAGEKLKERFLTEEFGTLGIPVVFNATGQELQAQENIPDMLVKQVQSSVYFQSSVEYMLSQGVDTFVEIGPGAVLSGFVKKIVKEKADSSQKIELYSVSDVDSLEKMLESLQCS